MEYLIELKSCTNNVISSIHTDDTFLAIKYFKVDLKYREEHSGSKIPYELTILKSGKPVTLSELEKMTVRN
jgi:hypothetical protein